MLVEMVKKIEWSGKGPFAHKSYVKGLVSNAVTSRNKFFRIYFTKWRNFMKVK
jgi:hypothetical protein